MAQGHPPSRRETQMKSGASGADVSISSRTRTVDHATATCLFRISPAIVRPMLPNVLPGATPPPRRISPHSRRPSVARHRGCNARKSFCARARRSRNASPNSAVARLPGYQTLLLISACALISRPHVGVLGGVYRPDHPTPACVERAACLCARPVPPGSSLQRAHSNVMQVMSQGRTPVKSLTIPISWACPCFH